MFYNIFFDTMYFFCKKDGKKFVYINNLVYFCQVKLIFFNNTNNNL